VVWLVLLAGSIWLPRLTGGVLAIAAGCFIWSVIKDDPVDEVPPPISPEAFLDWWMDGRPLRDD
jgi:hypothetical protein